MLFELIQQDIEAVEFAIIEAEGEELFELQEQLRELEAEAESIH